MAKPPRIRWRPTAQPKDFAAAQEYLALRVGRPRAKKLADLLADAPVTQRRANDILRAACRAPAPAEDPGVQRKLRRVVDGKRLTPALVAAFEDGGSDVCQGYHELSAVYWLDPFAAVPVLIAYEEK